MKLLLVEDEKRLGEALAYILKKNGYLVDLVDEGETGAEMATTGVYDIIILDRMLPRLDGIEVLKEVRSKGYDTPVIFLTAKDAPKDRVEGLDAGADDYLIKPFSTEELLARLRALFRRKGRDIVGTTITAAGLILDPLKGEVIKDNEILQLSNKESQLLELLMRNSGQVVSKNRIFEKVWGYFAEAEAANVELYIHYLRKKLRTSSIKTVRGVGYCLQESNNA